MGMMDEMMDSMMAGMSKEEKQDMIAKMMEKFFADMTAEDKQKMMEQMMPRMMEGVNMMEIMPRMMASMMGGGESGGGMMGMMSGMMADAQGTEMAMMPQMMSAMMPQCLTTMLPNIPKEQRIEFVLKMVTILLEQGSVGMSEEEKRDFVAKVVEKAKT
jgi:hypothetical protein